MQAGLVDSWWPVFVTLLISDMRVYGVRFVLKGHWAWDSGCRAGDGGIQTRSPGFGSRVDNPTHVADIPFSSTRWNEETIFLRSQVTVRGVGIILFCTFWIFSFRSTS